MDNYFTNTLEWLNRAQQIAGIGIWNQEIGTNSLWWSDQTYNIFDMEPQSEIVTLKTFHDMIHPDDVKLVEKETARLLSTYELPYCVEYKIITRLGKTKILYEEAIIEYCDDNQPMRIIGVIKDVTDEREENLKLLHAKELSEQRKDSLHVLMNNIPGMVYKAHANWSAEIINGCEDICGYTSKEIDEMERLFSQTDN